MVLLTAMVHGARQPGVGGGGGGRASFRNLLKEGACQVCGESISATSSARLYEPSYDDSHFPRIHDILADHWFL